LEDRRKAGHDFPRVAQCHAAQNIFNGMWEVVEGYEADRRALLSYVLRKELRVMQQFEF
jgi:hypothetical protein